MQQLIIVGCVDGRHLTCEKCSTNGKSAMKVTGGGKRDFRPTSPGHSPGVGHSLNN
ncbi:hypothetical protein Acr_27g0004820 [Actinidia rufa]|uniref:Uncharacterized protein n=1 Tax=Actinidia rufa TaxID=165716 RepID=A0A7J0H6L2_9ERIC|nr:hypothetical protein Acr_27g0004820 [Actinidia rufa]